MRVIVLGREARWVRIVAPFSNVWLANPQSDAPMAIAASSPLAS